MFWFLRGADLRQDMQRQVNREPGTAQGTVGRCIGHVRFSVRHHAAQTRYVRVSVHSGVTMTVESICTQKQVHFRCENRKRSSNE